VFANAKKSVLTKKVPPRTAKHEAQLTLCLIKHHKVKTSEGVEVQPHTFLILALYSGQFHATVTLLPAKEPPQPMDRWLGGAQSQSEYGGKKNPSRKSNPNHYSHSLVTTLSELSLFLRATKQA
jgi:hypothetical protein